MRPKEFPALVSAGVIAELNHQINSPLAAIRNALYLAASRCPDPEVHRYLELADGEVASIAAILRRARRRAESLNIPAAKARAACAGDRKAVV